LSLSPDPLQNFCVFLRFTFCFTMKLLDTVLLSLAVAFLIMGVYEVMTAGLAFAYSFLMPSIILLLWFLYRKRSRA